MNGRELAVLGAGLAAALSTSPLVAQELRYEGGVSVATGSYIFDQSTTSWALYSGLSLRAGTLVLRAGIPVYLQNSTLVAGSSIGSIPTGGSSSGSVADSGQARKGRGGSPMMGAPAYAATEAAIPVPGSALTDYRFAVGDPTGQLGLRVLAHGPLRLTLSALAKAPVADTATFGTGQWDIGAGASLAVALGARAQLTGDIAYWHMGDMPDLPLRDPVYGSLGVAGLLWGLWSGGLMVSASSPVLDGYDPAVEIGAMLLRSGRRASWGITGGVGLTETVPSLRLGLVWGAALTH